MLGFLFSRLFLMVFEKNLKIWKKHKNCFVDCFTYSKDTSGGLVLFDSALNVLPRGYSPYAGFFIFPTFFMVFEKNLNLWKKYKNCFVDFSTYSKDTSKGLVPFDSALNVLHRGYSPPRWVFYFPDFFYGFWKQSKILKKNTKNCLVDLSTYSKDTSRGLVPFYLAINVVPRGYSSPRWVFYFPDFFWRFLRKI